MKIYYITENNRKIAIAKEICKNTNIEIEQIIIDTPEIQSTDSAEIAKYSAKFAGEKLGKPVLKLDVSFHISALNGFPGPFVKYINQWLSPEQILKIMDDVADRTCYWVNSLAYYNGGVSKVFMAKEYGTISHEVRGENGWGMDKIFIPIDQQKTKAELTDSERIFFSNKNHWKELIDFIKKQH